MHTSNVDAMRSSAFIEIFASNVTTVSSAVCENGQLVQRRVTRNSPQIELKNGKGKTKLSITPV